MLKDKPPSQLFPRLRVVLALDQFQELRNTINLEPAITRFCPVHHSAIEPRSH
jgi:hypothetical protein